MHYFIHAQQDNVISGELASRWAANIYTHSYTVHVMSVQTQHITHANQVICEVLIYKILYTVVRSPVPRGNFLFLHQSTYPACLLASKKLQTRCSSLAQGVELRVLTPPSHHQGYVESEIIIPSTSSSIELTC